MPARWTWVALDVAHAIHDCQLAEHGGATGARDIALLESAIARPISLAAYGAPDAASLAAAYAYGLAKNHGFVDGNKRTAWVIARLFLRLNNIDILFQPADAAKAMERVAEGTMNEVQLAGWFRSRIQASQIKKPVNQGPF